MSERYPPVRDTERRLAKLHRGHSVRPYYEGCWRCGERIAKCRSKQQFARREDAWKVQDEIHLRENFTEPLAPYSCRICGYIHLAHATRGQSRKKARRRWALLQRRLAAVPVGESES